MDKIKVWFKNLTIVGRLSVLITLAMGGLILVGATSSPIQPATNTVQETTKEPVITTKTETETIPFESTTVNDSTAEEGTSYVKTVGINGTKTITHTIILTDGIETSRTSTEVITAPPITEVVAIGTYVKPVIKQSSCDSNYSGCVPIASDVDCASGSGNGPAYVSGPVYVTGYDIYGLDRDGNGIGCE